MLKSSKISNFTFFAWFLFLLIVCYKLHQNTTFRPFRFKDVDFNECKPIPILWNNFNSEFSRNGQGNSLSRNLPFTLNSIDACHLHGNLSHSERGSIWQPTAMPEHPLSFDEKVEAFRGYGFNTVACNSIPLDRFVPLMVPESCLDKYQSTDNIGPMSVVIIFHNENLAALLRTLHSVLNRTSPTLLKEIVLVDDYSNATTHPWLQDDLEKQLAQLPKIKFVRLAKRNGLMRARVKGAALASAPVLYFLDSHVEVAPFWAEPVLSKIADDPSAVIMPRIMSVESDSFNFVKGGIDLLGFSASLGQIGISREIDQEYVPSPAMAGGIFAISRLWFFMMGAYDDQLELYGGEEFEMSFKAWMCGGGLFLSTCSAVGHVFRTNKFWKGQVYPVSGSVIWRNKVRVAKGWMDDYAATFSELVPYSNMTSEDVSKVHDLRKTLNCKDFAWYLKNVFPEAKLLRLRDINYKGAIENSHFNLCLDNMGRTSGAAMAYSCHNQKGTQYFVLHNNLIKIGSSNFVSCIAYHEDMKIIVMVNCDSDAVKNWEYNAEKKQLRLLNYSEDLCLEFGTKMVSNIGFDIFLKPCMEIIEQQITFV